MSELVTAELIGTDNADRTAGLERDFDVLGEQLQRRGLDIDEVARRAGEFAVALPSWGVRTGGTRFARFAGPAEPRNVFEKLEDCAVIHALVRCTPRVSPHFPWDRVDDRGALRAFADELGLGFDSVNSNTFQDQPGQPLSYKFGSLTHTDAAVRDQAVAHNLECIEWGRALGSTSLTVWIADGSNFPGQQHFIRALERYLDSMRRIYAALPEDWQVFLEHKVFEPAFYASVIQDWGTSALCAMDLGPKAKSLVDLGHHAPNVNIELVVARLIQFRKLAGFHFNDSKYGDDDLDSGSINPYQLFLVFNELVDAAHRAEPQFSPAYLLDQSHNVTDPIESLMSSAMAVQRAYVKALLVDRGRLYDCQDANDALQATLTLKRAYETDVSPILAMARRRAGGAIDPIATYRRAGYREALAPRRPSTGGATAGIV
jgi:L-rhamnose isomerase/sugar isomerase